MATVAITDATFPALDVEEEILAAAGARVVRGTDPSPAGLAALVATADAVITQFARVDAGVIGAM